MPHARSLPAPFASAALMAMLAVMPSAAAIHAAQVRTVSLVLPAQAGCQVAGPFVTMRRANEVAAEARRRGYSAVAYHDDDGYYVRAC
ncbi:hypothetical protein AAFN86_08250 [Roseomonas sp. CAU 1739]|uniref:hypothetical protein n=1 Tax=Roseomonas sp. CAU 1739 TaxID=3140364 RepID=UPI00325B9B3A